MNKKATAESQMIDRQQIENISTSQNKLKRVKQKITLVQATDSSDTPPVITLVPNSNPKIKPTRKTKPKQKIIIEQD